MTAHATIEQIDAMTAQQAYNHSQSADVPLWYRDYAANAWRLAIATSGNQRSEAAEAAARLDRLRQQERAYLARMEAAGPIPCYHCRQPLKAQAGFICGCEVTAC